MIELDSLDAFDAHVRAGKDLAQVVLQRLDLTARTAALLSCPVDGAIFLGCRLAPEALKALHSADVLLLPSLPNVPFKTYRATMYTPEELYEGFDPADPASYADTLDARILEHWRASGRAAAASILETLCRRLHDHAITDALRAALAGQDTVAVIGGHLIGRDRSEYRQIAELAHALTRRGYLIISGGGPGAMEAANLGAYFATRAPSHLHSAIDILTEAPRAHHPQWASRAFEVRHRYPLIDPDTCASIGVPTWLYGHEPPNPFATDIAKYFANSVREDGLGTVARSGIIFAPGSAGTVREIYADACQNHYAAADSWTPMVFLGEAYWTATRPVFPMLAQMAAGQPYAQGLHLTDDPDEVIAIVERRSGRPNRAPTRPIHEPPTA